MTRLRETISNQNYVFTKIVLKVKKDERYFYISKTNLSQWGGGGSQNQKSTKER